MSEFTEIKIGLEVYKHIQSNLLDFNETPNSVLKRLLGLEKTLTNERENTKIEIDKTQITNSSNRKGMLYKSVFFPEGMRLRKNLKGVLHEAIIRNGQIIYNGKGFFSPSAAGIEASKSSVNGWIFWEYLNETSGRWHLLDELRKGRTL